MTRHVPVLLKEVIENLNIKDSGVYIDATLGGGGYFEQLIENLNRCAMGSLLIGIDQDIEAIRVYVEKTKKDYKVEIKEEVIEIEYKKIKAFKYKIGKTEIVLVNSNFSKIADIAHLLNKDKKVLGIVADLGFSSDQLVNGRGFSFKNLNDELDMRMDLDESVKAKDLLNDFGVKELTEIFLKYADEPKSRVVAEELVNTRKSKKFEKVNDLLKALDKVKGILDIEDFYRRIFQALRIAVNKELENLDTLLTESLKVIDKNGRVLIVSFHSGEERIIKDFITKNNLTEIKVEPITPRSKEILKNPRSRSAKLRGYIKFN